MCDICKTKPRREYCVVCDKPTVRDGESDYSITDEHGNGPHCEACYDDIAETHEAVSLSGSIPGIYDYTPFGGEKC
jgi:hypothetical protein